MSTVDSEKVAAFKQLIEVSMSISTIIFALLLGSHVV